MPFVNPSIAVIVPTYGRLQYLPRVLASFLSQEYCNKELIIVNDEPGVHLECNYDNVSVINLTKQILLPDKRNVGISLAKAELVVGLDDDDIILPDRLCNLARYFEANPECESYFNPCAYSLYEDTFSKTTTISTTNTCFTKDLWYKVGGYTGTKNKGEDVDFFKKISEYTTIVNDENHRDFIYMWSSINYHATHHTQQEIDKIALSQNIKGEYLIESNCSQYCNIVKLVELYKRTQQPIQVTTKGVDIFYEDN